MGLCKARGRAQVLVRRVWLHALVLFLLTISTSGASVAAEICSFVVSPGDAGVGIAVVTDPICKISSGVGCFGPTSVCRYCKSKSTPQCNHLRACESFSSSSRSDANPVVVSPSPTPAPTPASTPSPASITVTSGGTTLQTPPADFCSDAPITTSLAITGVWAVFDPSCPRDDDLGDCNEYCRLCQFVETSASTNLRSCASVLATVAAAAMADSEVWSSSGVVLPDTPPASQCTATLVQDAVNSGIWMTFTYSNSDSGSGRCLQARCNYCKYFETQVSSGYPPRDDPVSIIGTGDGAALREEWRQRR